MAGLVFFGWLRDGVLRTSSFERRPHILSFLGGNHDWIFNDWL